MRKIKEEQEKSFVICRASVIFDKEMTLFNYNREDSPQYRNSIFCGIIGKLDAAKKFLYRNNEFVAYAYKSQNVCRIDIGREREDTAYKAAKDGFEPELHDSYVKISIYVDCKTQTLFIQRKTSIMPEMASIHCLEEYFNLYAIADECTINILPKNYARKFWETIEEAENNKDMIVNEMQFELLTPNLFGANDIASELAKYFNKNFNTNRTIFKLVSDKGLVVHKDEVGSYVDYTSEGTGTWSLKLKNMKTTTKYTVTNKDAIKKAGIVIDNTNKNLTEIEIRIIEERMGNEQNQD